MREMGVYCSDYHCSHWGKINADRWSDDVRLSDLEPLFVCQACGTRPADLRPNFHWEKEQRLEKTPSRAGATLGARYALMMIGRAQISF
jgi:hypothetical protein